MSAKIDIIPLSGSAQNVSYRILTPLKLFVWENSLVDYTPGVMFALAENVEQARKLIYDKDPSQTVLEELQEDPVIYDSPVGYQIYGGG